LKHFHSSLFGGAGTVVYSLIKTGVHGTNGLNTRTSCKIYQVYVIPRLLYGLETLNLKKKDMAIFTHRYLVEQAQLSFVQFGGYW
jgi:hypothetical protein